MMSYRVQIYVLILSVSFTMCEGIYGYVTIKQNTAVSRIVEDEHEIPAVFVAKASYYNKINTTGWAFLEIHTTRHGSDEQQAYAAGYLEGFLTRDLIWYHWLNMLKGYCFNKTDTCALIEKHLDQNEEWIAETLKDNGNDPYWYQLKLYYTQLEGLAAGYKAATKESYERLTSRDIFWINMLGDLDDLATALSTSAHGKETLLDERCTGLVKLLPDHTNLFVAHATWNSYQSMLRLQKMYVLQYRLSRNCKAHIPGYKMAFTSYPAFVQSTDDFYITSSSLVISETTIANTNRDLYVYVRPTGQILEFIRVMVANRLARSGSEWVSIFRRYNSGTYNNQWFIVDLKNFKARKKDRPGTIKPGLLWVVEQLPGHIEAADLTEKLVRDTYFPSYNIQYFPRMFNLSGGWARVDAYGPWFGYHTNPRGRILKEKQAGILTFRDMFVTMRYNDYKHDPLSRCARCRPPYSACNAIAARNDLNPARGKFPFRALGHRSHGAIDAKVTSATLAPLYAFVAVSSPPHNRSRGIPPFRWSEFDLGSSISHVGHPDLWTFSPLVHRWEW